MTSTTTTRPDGGAAPAAPPAPRAEAPPRPRPAPAILVTAAALSLAAGGIHLAMVPPHAAESAVLAVGFGLSGWFQLGTGLAMPWWPRRPLFGTVAVANAAFVVVWAISRTVGLPVGEHAGQAEAATFVDQATVVLEVALVALAAALVARPALGRSWRTGTAVIVTAPAVAALVLATAAIASPSASSHTHGDAASGHAHDHASGAAGDAWVPVDVATQRTLSDQLAQARAATMRYPTVADLKAAGGKRLSVFTPYNGAHHTIPVPGVPVPEGGFDLKAIMGNVSGFDPANPPIALYSSTEDTAVVVGVMYVVFSDAEPEGFAGPNDHWHRHQGVCARVAPGGGLDILLPISQDTTKEQCDAVGGNHLPVTPWMLHVWTAPGWESTAGVFSHENPRLTCADGRALAAEDFVNGCRGLA
ncbi:MAG: hypothetical protein U0Q07_11320 [Acidimicrobiales bacterium]